MKFFLLDKQQNIIGRLSEEYILEATFTEEINTAGELLITLPAKKRLSGNVIHVLITNPSKDHSYLMFKIIKETVKDEEVEYTAVESAYDELTSYGYIQDKRPTANAQTIAEMILKDTRWHVGEIPDTSEAFISFYYLSVLDCLKKIVQTFDFEIGFDVLINDDENQITDRRVNFYIKQGEQTGKRFEYGSNLLSIKQEQDTQNIYTALVGRGKGVQVSGGDDDNTPDGYGRRITFANVEWSKANGDPLDKPKGQEWLEDPDATKQLGFSDGHMRIGLEVFEDVDDPKTLLQKTYEALKTAERPQVQFSASVINTGELHLGDRVGITRNDIGIAYETRVFKVQHNLLDETQNKIDLGDNLEQTNNLSYQVSALQSEVTNNTEGIITVTQSANGKNKVYYSSTMPATGSNGDVWYKDLGNGETEMYIYDNGWQLVISTENLHKIEDEIKQQQSALGQAVQDANAASAKADGLVAQVGDANTNAQKALTTAQQNQADLTQAKNDLQNTKSQLSNVQTGLTSATANISQAQAELEAVKSQAAQQGQTIVNIQKSTDSLSSQIADVKGNVTGLQQTATSLQSAVENNKNDISVIKQTADGLQATVSNIDVNNKNLFSVKKATVQNGIVTSDFIPIIPGKTYILTIYNQGSGTNTFGKYFEEDKATSGDVPELPGDGNTQLNNGSVVIHVPDNQSLKYIQILIGLWDFNNISADQLQVSFTLGDSPVEYQPSVYDEVITTTQMKADLSGLTTLVNNNKGDISQLKQTSDSLTSQIGNANNDISSLKQRANSMESNISDNKNDISDLRQTANSLQSNIQSKTDISQFTQLSNEFQTVVQNIGAFLPDGDFSEAPQKYWIPWDTIKDYSNLVWNGNDPNNLCMQINAHNGEFSKYITKDYIRINPNASVVYTGKSWFQRESGADGDFQAYIHYYDANKNEISYQQGWYRYDGDGWWNFNITQTPPNNAMYLRIESTVHSNHGNVDGLLTNLALQNGKGSISSKISQMADDINMRVQKGDLLSQINIQAGSTLIQSNKLYLDASSVVFSGNAFIPSAAITDLSADKITAGTLNAYKVNVINLDVNKLVGDTTEFVRSGWTNAYGSHVQIDGGGMTVNYGNWYTRFDGNGMTFKDGGDNLGGFTRVGMTGAPDWYNGLAFNAGGDAEFLSIGAQDYGNDNQNPVPAKLLWMRSFDDKNRYGYQPGWNFCDTVWADDLKLNHIGTSSYRLDLVALSMNGETAFGLQSGNGYGFWWGANGGLGIYGGGKYVNFTHTKFINDIQMGQGGSINWSSL